MRLAFPAHVVLLFLCSPLVAHPPKPASEGHSAATRQGFPAGIALPHIEGPAPWTDKPLLNSPGRFHFAVMTDRTGGHRPGIWMQGVRNLNLMRPEFVVSVGDLIEGYTEDETELDKQWREFLGFIDRLDMRFFFVAGNHDLSNPVMHRMWRERFGPEWYSFDYKGVHFVCLSSEDPQSRIGDSQLDWLAGDLRQHASARWTFVFLHKPLWIYAEREFTAGNPDSTNWKQVETLLGERPHTVFAGHVHHYVQYDRNGTKYYHLGTTGGGSRLRGRPYGEFDHVVWVTMEPDGPRIANLLLDSILPPDAVTEQSIARFREFLAKSSIRIAPILIETGEHIAQGTIHIRLQNDFEQPVRLSGRINGLPLRGLSLDTSPLSLCAAPGKYHDTSVVFRLQEPVHFEHFAQTSLTAQLRSSGGKPLNAELTLPVTIDRRYICPEVDVAVDGDLGEWSSEEYQLASSPLVVGAGDEWQGSGDCSLRFRIGHDHERLYLSGTVVDDRVVAGDRIDFCLDARQFDDRVSRPQLGDHAYAFRMSAPTGATPAAIRRIRPTESSAAEFATIAATSNNNGYQFEVGLPIRCLTRPQGTDWQSFQLTPVVHDVDAAQDHGCIIVWRGTPGVRRQNTNLAHFFRSGAD